MSAISIRDDGHFILRIHVKPNAKQSQVVDDARISDYQTLFLEIGEEEVSVAIAAPAIDNKANEELLRFIAKTLGIKKNAINIEAGCHSRTKTILVKSTKLTLDQLHEKLTEGRKD
ncbi:unnamed protein product [Dracunculus medinensis]|uniref:UPF0235 protein n=1 Tax=Dracunculus medinensis TaxID=318479 RepID=A0A0N4UAI6_DRAME|nr:unnamed protein product [Dracunculus medinensis]